MQVEKLKKVEKRVEEQIEKKYVEQFKDDLQKQQQKEDQKRKNERNFLKKEMEYWNEIRRLKENEDRMNRE